MASTTHLKLHLTPTFWALHETYKKRTIEGLISASTRLSRDNKLLKKLGLFRPRHNNRLQVTKLELCVYEHFHLSLVWHEPIEFDPRDPISG